MLIISGSAEFIGKTNMFVKGDLHAFTMFCSNENLQEQLKEIEVFFNQLDWDEIVIEKEGIIENTASLENDTLKQAFDKASQDKLSVVIQNTPLSVAA
ncbi:hypothetical protein ACPUVO_15995 [Pseudocolwellia sp. HL-MZ19]|uniref:hypothetical protein n=1 Tax=unclassified Pseudocolwellia TaxID=2848178 RepID=UPI003CFA95F4